MFRSVVLEAARDALNAQGFGSDAGVDRSEAVI
jgi:hypothetical protein